MALSSQSLSKRGCHFGYDGNGNNYNSAPNGSGNNKRMCLGISKDLLSYHSVTACYSSSDVNESDLEDEQSCYRAEQVRAQRRASLRMSFSVNPNVSRAIAKYSDEDDEHNDESLRFVDNIDCKLLSTSSKTDSSINLAKLKRRAASSSSFNLSENDQANNTITNSQTSVNKNECLSPLSCGGMKRLVPSSDKNARSRCFDYLVSAIDEAWARYCTATSYTEEEEEAEENEAKFNSVTPASIATDEEDYFGNTTDITDYEDSDFGVNNHKHRVASGKAQMYQKLLPVKSISVERNVDLSSQLQALKDRLTKAKYYLQDLVDSEDLCEVGSFWKRWDMIKYATIELVEDDDDDDVVESTIEDLEDGRFYQ